MNLTTAKEKFKNIDWKAKFQFIFNWKSNFYFGIFVFILATIFFGWLLLESDLTHLVTWDYSNQFIPFYYHNYDIWKHFFSTGEFVLYDYDLFLGTDNIGSNSFYSLFDPFVVICVLFPREWVPQVIAIGTAGKLTIGALSMVYYLEYMGINKVNSRIGGICFAFSGWTVFMFGFPSYLTVVAFLPLILLGIEKVIKQKKCLTLIIGLFLLGISNFFFLVCACIWGVIYSMWRYFTTLKARGDNWKGNVEIMIKGVTCFALGLGLCAFTLLPSLRNSSLSGRSNSIGSAYFDYIKTSLKSHDLKTFFYLVFEEVGDNPGRELMSVSSFFFPSESYYYLPTVMTSGGSYDAWTSSIFVYTPCVIGCFLALLNSIRLKKYHHIFGLLGCLYLLLTNFSYFFFYAFSGNGYGRWFIVLIPTIIYYAMWGLEQRKEEPRWFPVLAGILAVSCTIIAFCSFYWLLEGKKIEVRNGMTYFKTTYEFNAAKWKIDIFYYLYSQIGFIIGYCVLYVFLHKKQWVRYVFFLLLTAEVVIVGAHTSDYMPFYQYSTKYMGGEANFQTALNINNKVKAQDSTPFKLYSDMVASTGGQSKVFATAAGVNGTATFHSLMNFQTEDFAYGNHIKQSSSVIKSYNDKEFNNYSWSGYYSHKRFFFDNSIGYKYYVIQNPHYNERVNRKLTAWTPENVPFYAVELEDFSTDRNKYRVYKIPEEYDFGLGHAVSSDMLYRIGKNESTISVSDNKFIKYGNYLSRYSNNTYKSNLFELERFQLVESFGAIFEDDAVVDEHFEVKEDVPDCYPSSYLVNKWGFEGKYYGWNNVSVKEYITGSADFLYPKYSSEVGANNDLNYFFDTTRCTTVRDYQTNTNAQVGHSHFVFTPRNGGVFSTSGSTYIEVSLPDNITVMPTIMLFDEDNNLLTLEKLCLASAKTVGDVYYYGAAGTFGMYAKGNVAKIVVMYEGNGGTVAAAVPHYDFFVYEGTLINKYINQWKDDSLKNVKYGTNGMTFKTNYAEPRVVVTKLGYDAGWKVSATDSQGKAVKATTYKLDGGLVGFTLPAGELNVSLTYNTPFLKEGKILFVLSLLGTIGLVTYPFVISFAKKHWKKKEDQVNA